MLRFIKKSYYTHTPALRRVLPCHGCSVDARVLPEHKLGARGCTRSGLSRVRFCPGPPARPLCCAWLTQTYPKSSHQQQSPAFAGPCGTRHSSPQRAAAGPPTGLLVGVRPAQRPLAQALPSPPYGVGGGGSSSSSFPPRSTMIRASKYCW